MPKKSKSKSAKKTQQAAAPVVEEQQVAPTPEPVETQSTQSTETTEDTSLEPSVDDDFTSLMERFVALRKLTSDLIRDARRISKRVVRELRDAERKNRRRRKNKSTTKRAPSGFAKPSAISEELCDFLNCEHGTQMARTEVTKFLTQYIKQHDLQDPSNRRRILCDEPLASLLSVGPEDEVTYFNLQKYMKPHFPKQSS